MLFDLRGRGRRRAVQGIYLALALLMGGGLVLFGIGGATNGGLLDAFKNQNGTANVSDVFKKRIDAAETAVRKRPQDPKAWAQLTRVRVQEASVGGYDQNTGTFNASGKQQLRRAEQAWNRYLKLTDKPDQNVATLMVQAYGRGALNEPAQAVNAMEIVINSRKATGPMYAQLAALAYEAGQTRKAELASAKAMQLTPKGQRSDLKQQLNAIRAQYSLSASSGSSGSAGAGAGAGSSGAGSTGTGSSGGGSSDVFPTG